MSTKTRTVDLSRTSLVKEATRIQQRARRGETVVVRTARMPGLVPTQKAP